MIKTNFLIALCLLICVSVFSQGNANANVIKDAQTLEKQFKEPEALELYKTVLKNDASNIECLVKCTELSCSIGARQADQKAKAAYYQDALGYAQKAITVNAGSSAANYAMALAAGKMTEIEDENKKIVAYVKQIKEYGDKALALDPNNAKANYIAGKWHYEMNNLHWAKKVAVKTLYGGLPKASLDSAIYYMDKCCKLDVYFTPSYLDLAKAYIDDDQPGKAIEVLNKLVKLPNRVYDDAAIKAEGKKMLEKLQ